MNLNINLNLYKYFYEVAKYNSYTKAAESLMISQPSLSYSIKVLETQLEKKLFIRENNKIKLTDEGEDLYIYNRLDAIFKQFEEVNNEDDYRGKITLGVRSAYAFRILPNYINELNKIHPNLEIDYIIGKSEKLLSLLENKQIDILIDEQKVDTEGYKSVLQAKNKVILFTTKEKAKRIKSDVITLDYLKDKKIGIVKRNLVTKEIMSLYPNLNYNIVLSSPLMLIDVEKNDGFGISPISVIRKELERGELVQLDTDFIIPDANIYLSYIKRLENKNIKCVIDFFVEHQGKLLD